MPNRIAALPIIVALTVTGLTFSAADAGSTGRAAAISVPAVIGAAYNSKSRADSPLDVQRQRGYATAGAVRWLAESPSTGAGAEPVFNSPGVIGAMNERSGLARSVEEVRRQGGFATAAAVHWLAKVPASKKLAAS